MEDTSHILRNSDGNLYVPYLNWNGGRWVLNFNWLDNNFNDNGRLYLLAFNPLASHNRVIKNFRLSSLWLNSFKNFNLSSRLAYLAVKVISNNSTNILSILTPKVYRVSLGKFGKKLCHNKYPSLSKDKIGISAEFLGGALKISRRKKLVHTYNDIISLENLCLAWEEFILGKKRKSVSIFRQNFYRGFIFLS